jgi:hypothetical protein
VLARYGGEEFSVILPGCDVAEARGTVDRLRPAVPVPQTCSAGIAVSDGADAKRYDPYGRVRRPPDRCAGSWWWRAWRFELRFGARRSCGVM